MKRLTSHDPAILQLPFYQTEHITLVHELDLWCQQQREVLDKLALRATQPNHAADVGKDLVRLLGREGWLRHVNPSNHAGPDDARALCLRRQTFAYTSDLLDFAYSIQELSASALLRFGNDSQCSRYLPGLASGELIGAFALSELQAGSDVSAIKLRAERDGDDYILNGTKAWIAQGDIADVCIVIARSGEGPGALGLSAFAVDTVSVGFSAQVIDAIAPRSWANLTFDHCRIPAAALIGEPGQGFIVAIDLLDRFRMSVAAAGIGFARKAADIALKRAANRHAYQGRLLDLQLVKAALAQMEIKLSASSLLTARAAWALDQGLPFAKDAAIAKVYAAESAGEVVDAAVQIMGAAGIVANSQLECLYRQIRPLRIYEGASETLLMNIAVALDVHRVQERDDLEGGVL